MRGGAGARFAVLALLLAAAGMGVVLHASYPGHLNADSVDQLRQALSGQYRDWHPTFMALVWSVLLHVLPGPVGIIVLDNLLIWGALATLAIALRPALGWAALLLLGVPLLPGAVNYLGHVHKDVFLVAWLLATLAFGVLAQDTARAAGVRRRLLVLAHLCAAAALLTRLNVVFALVPLLLFINGRLGLRRNVLLAVVFIAGVVVAGQVQNRLLAVESHSPSDSIKTYNLLALSYYTGRNQFPGDWTAAQSKRIVESCYSPVQWDTAWMGACGFIHAELRRQALWGSPRLTLAWVEAVLRHPTGYFRTLAETFRLSLFDPNSRPMLYKTDNPWHWQIADDPPRPTTELAQDYVKSELNDQWGRPWVFVLVSVVAVLGVVLRRGERTVHGRLALAVLGSGLVYLLTHFFFNVSAEYRYFYWCGFAAYLGLLLMLLAWLVPRPVGPPDVAGGRVLSAVAVVAALSALALALLSPSLPTQRQRVTVTALDDRPVHLLGLHASATPKWMQRHFEGHLGTEGWVPDWIGYRSVAAGVPFIAELDMLRQSIEVVFATGPEMGRVAIESAGTRRVLDTATPTREIAVETLPAPSRAP